MQYGLTTSVMKRTKITNLPAGTENDYRFVWEVNYADICGKKLLIIVHADTRYSMIYSDIKQGVWKDLKSFIHEAIELAFIREGFSTGEISKYFEMTQEEIITKTHGRTVMGGINHLTAYLSYMEKVLVEGSFQSMITDNANRDICTSAIHPELSYVEPKGFFVQEMTKLLRG